MISKENFSALIQDLDKDGVTLVAVSKIQPISSIQKLYDLGHRHFGENYVQELLEKQDKLPADIHWHFIGHLQSNKVKYIAPFVHLIHGVDSEKLLKEINKQAIKANRTLEVLLQVFIADEETKFGLDEEELNQIMENTHLYPHVKIRGLMGMASFSDDEEKVRSEFRQLKKLFDRYEQFDILSTGMSGDYKLAIEEGSTMVRIGSLVFGRRTL